MVETANFLIRLRDKLSSPARKMRTALGRLNDKVGESRGRLKKMDFGERMSKQFTKVIKFAALAGAALVGFAAKAIVKTGAAFEESISAVGAVGLRTSEQVADLEERAKKLGATTKFTATEAAGAMEVMARAGFKSAQILQGVGPILDGAAAAGIGIAETANIVSNSLKGMGLEVSQTARIVDVLTVASTKTKSTIGSLGESMKSLSPVAKQLGVSFEDAVAMVALLQDAGFDASVAGNSTSVMLTKLASPTKAMRKEMESLGVAFENTAGDMLAPVEIFENFQKAAKGAGGNAKQLAFFASLVGLRGQKSALQLKDMFNSDKGTSLRASLAEVGGEAKEMAALRMKNLAGDFTLFKSAVDGVMVSLFQAQSGPLRDFVQGFTEWITKTSEAGTFVEILDSLALGLKIAFQWMTAIVDGTSDMFSLFDKGGSTDGLGRLVNLLDDLAINLVFYRDEISSVIRFTAMLAAASLLVLAAITAFSVGVVAAVASVGKALFDFGAFVVEATGRVIDDFKFALNDLWSLVKQMAPAIGQSLIDGFVLATNPALILEKMSALGSIILQSAKDMIFSLLNLFTENAPEVGRSLIDGMLLAMNPARLIAKITSVGTSVINAAKNVFGTQSPSTEFQWIGRMNMEGLEGGVDRALPSVIRSTEEAANDTLSSGSSGAESGSSGGSSTVINLNIEQTFTGESSAQARQAGDDVLEQITMALEKVS